MHPSNRLRLATLVFVAWACASCRTAVPDPVLDPETRADLNAVPCEDVRDLDSVFFARGSAALSDEARHKLAQNLYLLRRCPGVRVAVYGYTDYTAEETRAADELSRARAEAVRSQYARGGLDPSQVWRVAGLGTDPASLLTEADVREGPARSRRADTIPTRP